MFDNLSCDQAEDLLRRHGDEGSYLVSHFHDPESYGLSIRLSLVERERENNSMVWLSYREGGVEVYKHYSICIKEGNFQLENAVSVYSLFAIIVTFLSPSSLSLSLSLQQEPFKTIEQVVTYVQERMKPTKLVPIFHRYSKSHD